MASSYYTKTGQPSSASRGRSINVRAEFESIEAGFDAVETAMDLKAPKASPTFTGTLAAAAATLSGLLTGAAATLSGLLTLNGGQIKFPATQVPSSDANTLDDYEEGSFTPALVGSNSAGSGTYTSQVGSYVKIGKLVYVSGRILWSAHTGNGDVVVTGFPFTPIALSLDHRLNNSFEDEYFLLGASALATTTTVLSSSGSLYFNGTYIADA